MNVGIVRYLLSNGALVGKFDAMSALTNEIRLILEKSKKIITIKRKQDKGNNVNQSTDDPNLVTRSQEQPAIVPSSHNTGGEGDAQTKFGSLAPPVY